MKRKAGVGLILLLFLIQRVALSQETHTISGFVTDQATGERLINATVYVPTLRTGTTTNLYGFYSVSLPADSVSLIFSFIGYEPVQSVQYLDRNLRVDVALATNTVLKEVVVEAKEDNIIHSPSMGVHRLAMQTVKVSPALGGETDVMKTLQLLPGVSVGNEGSAGLYVRGGSPDQNLVLLDGVPVYNVNHLFGFLSVFNTDALHHVELIKGGIPARYGGRLSSVLNISMKEGNLKESKGVASISPVVGKFTYEAPIVKDKAAFIVSGRRSWLGDLAFPEGERYSLYDFNAKINTVLNAKNRLYLSVYTGQDQYTRSTDDDSFGFDWGNVTAAARWNTLLGARSFANVSAYYSRYAYRQNRSFKENGTSNLLRTSSEIKEWSLNADFDYQPNVFHTVKYGLKAALLQFNPDVVRARGSFNDTTFNRDQQTQSVNASVYLEDEIKIGRRWISNVGLRAALFSVNDRQYWNWQPRASARYLVNDKLSWKASYTRTVQYLHLLTNSSLGLPTDLWVSSTENTKPEQAWQVATGAAWSPSRQIEFTLEGYYRQMSNLIEYAEGASYLYGTSDYWEEKIVVGDGTAYGAELLLRKNTGAITGWLGYTLSWANRQFDAIDEGRPFPFRYDRRHDLSLLANYQTPTKKPTVTNFLSLTFTFNTGGATSFPEATYQGMNLPDWLINNALEQREYIASRNNFRVPSYHRLDLSFSNEKQKKGFRRTWIFSVYNVYNHLNAYFLYESNGKIKQISLFPIIPSIAYRLEF